MICLLDATSLQGSPTNEAKELEDYIHCLSTVKDMMNKQANFKVELKKEIVRGICVSPEKKEKFEQFQMCFLHLRNK